MKEFQLLHGILCDVVGRHFRDHDEFPLMVAAIDRKNALHFILVRFDRVTTYVLLTTYFILHDIVAYGCIAEAWAVQLATTAGKMPDPDDLPVPSECPDRENIAVLALVSEGGAKELRCFPILRPAGERPRLGPEKHSGQKPAGVGGGFFEIFDQVKAARESGPPPPFLMELVIKMASARGMFTPGILRPDEIPPIFPVPPEPERN